MADDALLEGAVVTAVAIAIDPNGAIYIANGGHPQPLIVGPNGVRGVCSPGPLPGLIASPIYQEVLERLEPGERLFVYTDGILSDAGSVGDLTHFPTRLEAELKEGLALPIEAAADRLMAAVREVSVGQTPDDWCCVLLELDGETVL